MTRVWRTLFVVACTTVLVTGTACAQLTLDECQRLARENYPLLQKYGLIDQTTSYTVRNINRGYWPQLVLSAQATYQSDVATLPELLVNLLETNGYDVKGLDRDQYRIALELDQPIWDGGRRRAEKKIARAQGDVSTAQTDVDMYLVEDRVNNLYFGILLLDDKLRINADLQALLLSKCDKLEAMCEGGTAMAADVHSMRAEYLKARQQMAELQSARLAFQQVLGLFIGRETAEIINLEKPQAIVPSSAANLRPEMSLFDAQIRHNDAQVSLLNSSVMPKINLFAQGFYGYMGYDMFHSMFDHDLTWGGMVGIRLGWNISNLYTHHTDRRRLGAVKAQIENAREVFLFNTNLQTVQEYTEINKYKQLMREDQAIIDLRTSVRQAAESKLELGIIDVNGLLQEITREQQALTDRSTHEIEMLKHIYELKHTVGQ